MQTLSRNPLVNLPPACPESATGAFSAWAYYVPHTATTTSGVEVPIFDSGFYWNALDAVDRTNELINTYGEPLNRAGAIVLARHCQREHDGTGQRLEIERTLIVADEDDVRQLGSVRRPDYDYQAATSFEPGTEPDDAQPLFLPFSRGSAFPDRVVPVSYGERRFLVAHSASALLISKRMLKHD